MTTTIEQFSSCPERSRYVHNVDHVYDRSAPAKETQSKAVLEHHEQAIVIPKNALQIRDNRYVVFVVEGAIAEMREVTTGIETREIVEIVTGLGEGERLVVKGHETLRDKSKVRTTE